MMRLFPEVSVSPDSESGKILQKYFFEILEKTDTGSAMSHLIFNALTRKETYCTVE